MNISKLPIYLITGFLGSGKTTFLQRIVEAPEFAKLSTALLINDAGPMNVDAKVFKNQAETVKALTGGCACCVVSKDLQREIRSFVADPRIDQVWIEASGVAEVEDLLDRLTEEELPKVCEVRRVIHVVDSVHYGRSLFSKALQHAQWRWADVVVLNKVDLIKAPALRELEQKVHEINPRALVVTSVRGVTNQDWSKGGERSRAKAGSLRMAHVVPVKTCWLERGELIKKASLVAWLRELPEEVYRVKGFLRLAESPQQIHWVHQVGLIDEEVQIWPYESPKEELGLVLLGSELEMVTLEKSWQLLD